MHDNCVLLTCNHAYLPYALFVAWQLENTVGKNFDIVIGSDDAAVEAELPTYVKFLKIDDVEIWKSVKQSERLKYFTYLRLPAIERLSGQYGRILYMDTDVFIQSRMISKLFSVDISRFALAAVRDVQQRDKIKKHVEDFKLNGLGAAPYFNAGVLLINSKLWRRDAIYNAIANLAKNSVTATRTDDQTLLNLALYKKWGELSPTWNWIESPKTNLAAAYVDANIVHIAGKTKHWDSGSIKMSQRFRRDFEIFTELHREFEQMRPLTPEPTEIWGGFLRALLLNWRWMSLSRRALNRFNTELDVLPTDLS